jgi:hypothetical protein
MEEKFYKEKNKDQELKDCLGYLEETRFNFACFVDSFKRYLEKMEKLF